MTETHNIKLGTSDEIGNDELTNDALRHAWVHQAPYTALAAPDGLKIFRQGNGSTLFDIYGREFIDGLSGAWVANVGHGRQEIAEAMAEQARTLAYVSPFNFLNVPAVELAKKLASLLPEPLNRIYLCSGGAESVETALAIARQYHFNRGEKSRSQFISRRGSYHGSAFGGKSVSGLRHSGLLERFAPLLPGVHHVLAPTCQHVTSGSSCTDCSVAAAREVERVIEHEGAQSIAAVIGEPISVSAATHVPAPEYWQIIREACDRHGILLIFDEVLVGMGRTGRWFAAEHFGVTPDIVTLSKGIASGYAPIAAVGVADHVAETFLGDANTTLSHGYTYGNHAVSSAASLKNIEILENENLIERCNKIGKCLQEKLLALQDRHRSLSAVRGLGLLIALEVVQDRETRQPFPPEAQMSSQIFNYLLEAGVFCRVWDVIHVAPPFVVTDSEVEKIVDAVDYALKRFEENVGVA